MAQRLLRTSVLGMLTFALLFGGGSVRADGAHTDPSISASALLGSSAHQGSDNFELHSAIAFSSTRDNPTLVPPANAAEIYLMLMSSDGTPVQGSPENPNPRRLTNNVWSDGFPVSSPDGKKFVFISNRLRVPTEPPNTFDLFIMNTDGTEQVSLTRGNGGTWSPDGKRIAFHASASGKGLPINDDPGAAPADSDIFVVNVDDCRKVIEATGVDDCRKTPGPHVKNITNSPHNMNPDGTPQACPAASPGYINDDPDWSPDGTMIVFTRHPSNTDCTPSQPPLDYPHAEIYVMRVNPDGTPVQDSPENPNPRCLTCPPPNVVDPLEEERAPGWSPDGQHILFMCRTGGPDFELCTIKADGKDRKQLTNNGIGDLLGPRPWSPDAYPDGKKKFVFHRALGPGVGNQLFVMTLNQDGACQPACAETQLTFPLPPPSPPGLNLIASWGKIRVHVKAPKETQPARAPAGSPVPKR